MTPPLDPLYWQVVRWTLAGIFALGLLHKLGARAGFEDAVRNYRLLPARMAPFVARLFILLEAAVVTALVSGLWLSAAAVLAAGLLALYGISMAINMARGRRDIDCGCFGPAGRAASHALNGWLLLRNLVLISISGLLLLPVAARDLLWLDLITIATAVAGGLALYTAADQLIANGTLIKRLLQ